MNRINTPLALETEPRRVARAHAVRADRWVNAVLFLAIFSAGMVAAQSAFAAVTIHTHELHPLLAGFGAMGVLAALGGGLFAIIALAGRDHARERR